LIFFVWGPTFELPLENTDYFGLVYGILKMFLIPSILLAIFGYGKVLRSNQAVVRKEKAMLPVEG